jgi:hypothetical protein
MSPAAVQLPQLPAPDEFDAHGQGLYAAHRVLDLMLQAYARGAQSVQPQPEPTTRERLQGYAPRFDAAMRAALRGGHS